MVGVEQKVAANERAEPAPVDVSPPANIKLVAECHSGPARPAEAAPRPPPPSRHHVLKVSQFSLLPSIVALSVARDLLRALTMTTLAMPSQGSEKSPILVIGMGVIGLTTSVRLLQASHKVHILATQIPSSPLDPTYCSSAAGAHHLSFAADDDERQRRLDMRTFEVMMKEEAEEGEASAILRLTQREFYGTEGEKHIELFEGLPDVSLDTSHLLCYFNQSVDQC